MTMKCSIYFNSGDNDESVITYEIDDLTYDENAVILSEAVQRSGPGFQSGPYEKAEKHEVGFPMVSVIRWVLT